MSRAARIATSLVSGLMGWLVINSWRPMVSQPWEFLRPLLIATIVVCLVATGLRLLRVPTLLVALAEAVAGVVALHALFTDKLVPTATSVRLLFDSLATGASNINTYTAPLSAKFPDALTFLAFMGLLVVVAVEVIAAGLQRAPIAALPLLLALTVPISVLQNRLALPIFVGAAVAFLILLTLDEGRRLRTWGPVGRRRIGSLTLPAAIGVTTLVGAIALPVVIPVSGGGLFDRSGSEGGGGGGDGVTLVNPILDLRRDLIRRTHTPLVYARTQDADRKYLRTTVLDEFTGDVWKPSKRQLPARNKANGPLPPAPGMLAGIPGQRTSWDLQLGASFQTTWLPLPYPATSVNAAGDWRYDTRTLDVVDVGRNRSTRGMAYAATVFRPDITAERLAEATSPPGQILGPNVELPSGVPQALITTARQVTQGAQTQYEKLVLLQDFFTGGDFTYSLQAAPGSGMDLLADFVTTDRVGYCEQFSTAMALMARILNIPSRVSVGFLAPSREESGQYVYTSDELHAWPEFYFSGVGWVGFEPTPSTRPGAEAPAYSVPSEAEPTEEPSTTTAPSAQPQPALPVPQQQAGAEDSTPASGTTWWPWLLVPLLLLLGAVPRWWRGVQRRRRLAPGQSPEALARGAWAELRAVAVDHRIGWPEGRSPRETLARVRSRVSADVDLVARLDEFVRFVERARYGRPDSLTDVDGAALHAEVVETVGQWSAAMAAASGDRARTQARWLPRSLIDRAEVLESEDPELAHR